MITGILLVIMSWLLLLICCLLLGYPIAYFLQGRKRGLPTVRASMWTGLLIAVIVILAVGVRLPLSGGAAAAWFFAFTALGCASTFAIVVRNRVQMAQVPIHTFHWLLIAALSSAMLYLAAAALGPVTNYDSGLYHLGAIKYASEYATIPGLANLYFPFGYNTSLYPVGAFLGNGPWSGEGYRLANGFFIALLIIELVLRIVKSKGLTRNFSRGTLFLLVAVPLALIPLVSLSDYWVTSPSSDAAVMVMTFVSVAYLIDSLTEDKGLTSNASVAFMVAVVAFSLRPTMVVFLIAIAVVLGIRVVQIRGRISSIYLLIPAILGLALLAIQTLRDYLLSGWLQYPLSLFSFDVPWKALDPTENRSATLGNARNPEDIWGSVTGFDWLGPYVARLPSQWETLLVVALAGASLATVVIAKMSGSILRGKTLLVVQIPIVSSVLTWFLFSPPTFRFGWGPVFSFFLVIIAFGLYAIIRGTSQRSFIAELPRLIAPIAAVMLTTLVAFNAATRFQHNEIDETMRWALGPMQINYSVAPVITVPVKPSELGSGLVVTQPTQSDQCWDNYPLCTPIPSPSLSLRGNGLSSGFLR